MTALMLASDKGHLGVVQDLIQGGADTNKQHPVRSINIENNLFISIDPHRRRDGLPFSLLPKVGKLTFSRNYFIMEQELKLRYVVCSIVCLYRYNVFHF